jgi:hypothetical protein
MRKFLALAVIVLTAANGLKAQGVTTAGLAGRVSGKATSTSAETQSGRDETIPGANIVATHTPSGTTYGTVSLADGRFNLPGMRVGGPYTVRVSFIGYREAIFTDVYLALGATVTLNVQLVEEATELETIVVTYERGDVFSSDRTGAFTNVRREQFERLPTIGRTFQDFSMLTPQAGPGFRFGGRSNLYNNFTIDGATSNNVFGFSALPGGQVNSEPISVDAIEEISVAIAPYDVRQGAFTGAGVNAVTRSGTNEFSGSVYGFTRNQSMVGSRIAGADQPVKDFSFHNVGFRLGGPLVKNKLFFFVNYEDERRTDPAVLFPANTPGNQALFTTDPADANYNHPANIGRLQNFLLDPAKGWVFDPGTVSNFNVPTQSQKALAKIDWNISNNHKFTIRYNSLSAFRDNPPRNSGGVGALTPGGRQNNVNTIPFSNSWYRQNQAFHSVIAELNSRLGSRVSNTLTAGYSAFRDFREQAGGGLPPSFPTVDIVGPNGSTLTTFGPDPFAPNNRLNQDILQINNNLNLFLKNHTVSVGTANEFFRFENIVTAQIHGVYQFNGGIQQFIDNATAPAPANAPHQYLRQYSGIPGVAAPGAAWSTSQLGFYAQDEFTGIKNLKLIAGIRVDVPIFHTRLARNPVSEAMTFAGGERVDVSRMPNTTPLYSPRLGFNWDVFGNQKTQVRGGSGVFTGRVPFVWLSNQATINGILFGTIRADSQAATAGVYNFHPDPGALPLPTGPAPQFNINATVPDFRFPQVWRSNLAIDQKLPGGLIGTIEAIYTQDIHAVYIRDANMNAPIRNIDGDGRPQFPETLASNPTDPQFPGRRINLNIPQALVLDNTHQGYQWSVTAQLQKAFRNGFYASAAYTYTDSRDINSQTGTSAGTLLNTNQIVGNPNDPILAFSSHLTPHRVIASSSYRKEYLKHFATTLSVVYEARSGINFSYFYTGDMNRDGIANNDLIYVPRSADEIRLVPTNALDTRTPAEIWRQLDTYIRQDDLLNANRGRYAGRNAGVAPFVHLVNLRLLQDFHIDMKNGKRNTLQFSFEMVNFLNFLNSNWGLIQLPARPGIMGFQGFENAAVTTPNTETNPLLPSNAHTTAMANGRPIFTFPTNADGTPLAHSYVNDTGIGSRWQMQLGLRYIFN